MNTWPRSPLIHEHDSDTCNQCPVLNHGVNEAGRDSGDRTAHPLAQGSFSEVKLLRDLPIPVLNIKDRDFTTSLGLQLQCLTTFVVKKKKQNSLYLISFPYANLCPLTTTPLPKRLWEESVSIFSESSVRQLQAGKKTLPKPSLLHAGQTQLPGPASYTLTNTSRVLVAALLLCITPLTHVQLVHEDSQLLFCRAASWLGGLYSIFA